MSEEIFRKKSLDKIKSPENLDDYIRVSNPGVWLLLISIIVLLIGACVWGAFGHIDSTVPAFVRVENGIATCRVTEENISAIKVGQTVKFENREAVIERVETKDEVACICTLSDVSTLPDGFYEGEIIVDSRKPLSFVLN